MIMNRIQSLNLKIRKYKLRRFIQTYDKQLLIQRAQKYKSQKVVLINQGLYEYGYFNFAFLDNMLSLIIEALSNGMIPVVELENRKEGWTNWHTFFNQPLEVSSVKEKMIFKKKTGLLSPGFRTPYNKKDLALWSKIYTDFAVLNKETKEYVDQEYANLIANKKVLGVLCRGTDYVQKRPYGHPIQPKVDDVIALVKTKISEYGLEYIYLATEELSIFKQFESEFPDKILVNKRTYYDEIFYKKQCTDIYQVQFDRENDIYLKGLEYLSSIWLLSQCDALIAGNCGGSTSALYLNNGKYRYWHLFDLGLYGVE